MKFILFHLLNSVDFLNEFFFLFVIVVVRWFLFYVIRKKENRNSFQILFKVTNLLLCTNFSNECEKETPLPVNLHFINLLVSTLFLFPNVSYHKIVNLSSGKVAIVFPKIFCFLSEHSNYDRSRHSLSLFLVPHFTRCNIRACLNFHYNVHEVLCINA